MDAARRRGGVERQAVAGGQHRITTPKSDAGIRDIVAPPHILPELAAHLIEHCAPGPDGLMFPAVGGQHLGVSTFQRWFNHARAEAGRDDLRFHDLRHTGATMAAQAGATLAELMGRLGHTSASAALRYQHIAEDRDRALAQRLSKLAETES